jgi:CheY-like chemotaxis protein
MNGEHAPRVLVVDDEESIRLLITRGLQRDGFTIVQAKDGQDAIEQLDATPFDAMVLDLMMPRVDGFGVIDHLITKQPRMVDKTVVVTAFPKTAAKERLHHVCSVLTKPFDLPELIAVVRECARR